MSLLKLSNLDWRISSWLILYATALVIAAQYLKILVPTAFLAFMWALCWCCLPCHCSFCSSSLQFLSAYWNSFWGDGCGTLLFLLLWCQLWPELENFRVHAAISVSNEFAVHFFAQKKSLNNSHRLHTQRTSNPVFENCVFRCIIHLADSWWLTEYR